jgi:hypothetical protein
VRFRQEEQDSPLWVYLLLRVVGSGLAHGLGYLPILPPPTLLQRCHNAGMIFLIPVLREFIYAFHSNLLQHQSHQVRKVSANHGRRQAVHLNGALRRFVLPGQRGQLSESLANLTELLQQQANVRIEGLMAFLAPSCLIVLGTMIFFILFSCFMPLVKLLQAVS